VVTGPIQAYSYARGDKDGRHRVLIIIEKKRGKLTSRKKKESDQDVRKPCAVGERTSRDGKDTQKSEVILGVKKKELSVKEGEEGKAAHR